MDIQNGENLVAKSGQDGRKKEKESYAYKQCDSGPFKVMVEKKEENANFGINKISVGSVLKQNGFAKSVIDIKKIGRSRVMVYISEWQEANRLISCQNLKLKKLSAYIPRGFVTVKGVIAGIPEEMEDNEVIDDMETNLEVVEAFRMHRTTKDGKKVPTMKMGVVFRSNRLPDSVRVFSVKVKVEPYVTKVVMCNACLRYGHIAKYCKGRKRCMNCGDNHDNQEEQEVCVKTALCVHCKGEHKASDAKCPERGKQERIKRLMAVKNLSYHEAREQAGVQTRNMFSLLSVENEFPTVYESFANITKKKEVKERQHLQQEVRQAPAKKSREIIKKVKNRDEQRQIHDEHCPESSRLTPDSATGNKDADGFELVRQKKRKTDNAEKEEANRISMQQHLELRKRWDDKLKELAGQREELKTKVNETYNELYLALNTKDEDTHRKLLGVLNNLGQTLGFMAQERNNPEDING